MQDTGWLKTQQDSGLTAQVPGNNNEMIPWLGGRETAGNLHYHTVNLGVLIGSSADWVGSAPSERAIGFSLSTNSNDSPLLTPSELHPECLAKCLSSP